MRLNLFFCLVISAQMWVFFNNILMLKNYYNMASRATQSNSVHVSLLQIRTVHSDGVSKSLCQFFFFFARAAIIRAGKIIIFRYNNGYKQRLGPLVPKQTQFSDLFSWARVLKWGRKRKKKNKTREKEAWHHWASSRFASLSEGKMQMQTNFDRKTLL